MNPSSNNKDDKTSGLSALSEFRQKRDEYSTEIRKQKRDENLRKIRGFNMDFEKRLGNLSSFSGSFDTPANSQLKAFITEWMRKTYTAGDIDELIMAVGSNDRFKQHYGAIGLRVLLSLEQNSPVQEIIDKGAVPMLMNFIHRQDEPHLQLESTWALANVTSSSSKHTEIVVKNNGIENFLALLKNQSGEIAEHAIWAIGNIAGDSRPLREQVLRAGALEPLIQIAQASDQENLIKQSIWALSNICGGRPYMDFEAICPTLPIFAQALRRVTDPEVLTDVCWAIYHMSDTGNPLHYRVILESGVVSSLGELLDSKVLSTLIPVIKTFGNLTSDDETLTDGVLSQTDLIPRLFKLLNHPKFNVREKACWVLANIAAGNEHQVDLIANDPAKISKLISLAIIDKAPVVRECCWIFSNAIFRGNLDQVVNMTRNGIIECMVTILENSEEAKCLEVILDAINHLIKKGAIIASKIGGDNPFQLELEQKGALGRIEALQHHKNTDVYRAALKILEEHYETMDN